MNKRCAIVFCVTVLGFLVSFPPTRAQDNAQENISMYMGESRAFPVSNLKRVAVGNPSVADIVNVGKSEFTLVPKGIGVTTLTFWDAFGEQAFSVKVYAENVLMLRERAESVVKALGLPDVHVKADEANNRALIMGRVKVPQEKERITTAFESMKDMKDRVLNLVDVREEQGVIGIDVQVLELDRDATTSLGFSWPGSMSVLEVGSPGLAGTAWSNLFNANQWLRTPYTAKLDALVLEGKARILSRPRLSCQSGKEAELFVGGEVPNLTTNLLSGGGNEQTQNIDYKEFGIKLKIKPVITDDDRIKLSVKVEVSDVGEAVLLGPGNAPTALAYPLSKRNASTELFVDDGQTLSIGGLIKQKTEEDLRKFPWLGDIPVLGLFFRQRVTKSGGGAGQRGDTELFITLTPTIVSPEKKSPAKAPAPDALKAMVAQRSEAVTPGPAGQYAAIIQNRVYESLVYPPSAKQSGFQGVVVAGVHLSYTGKLLGVTVKSSSGYAVLDSAALKAVESIATFPPFPPAIKDQDMWIDIPVNFKLE